MSITDSEALDRIAEIVGPDDDGTWCDMPGMLESIGNLVCRTGRAVEGWE